MPRAWGLHAIVSLSVLAALMLAMWLLVTDAPAGFGMVIAFVWMPLALVYSAVSTIMVALLRPGRGWVALAHVVALALGCLATLFLVM